ncbi:ATP synthase f chain, mitochondrial precursor [Linderina pennispora]|nr:ATP synthase f chain, mitochondrial precursor [Linderina pennispora]
MNAVIGRTMLKRTTALRNYSSLREIIPPNIGFAARAGESAAPEAASGVAASAEDISKVVSLYRGLPKGELAAPAARGGPLARYHARYIGGDKPSGAPIVHVIGALLVSGYSIHYFMHLKHHKHAEHH